jgi:hypothetical protein
LLPFHPDKEREKEVRMIGSIAQGYAARALVSLTGKVFGEDRTDRSVTGMASTGATTPDTLTISGKGKLLAANELLLPTSSNIQALSASLSHNISTLLKSAGISSMSSFEIDVDERTMDITVKGDGKERAAIQKTIDGNEDIKKEIRTLAAISSHAAAMTESLKFQKEHAATGDPRSVVSKYAALFGQQRAHDISLRFDGTAFTVLADGKNLLMGRS